MSSLFVLDLLNCIAKALCYLFANSHRGFAATPAFVAGVKAYPIGFASKFMNARHRITFTRVKDAEQRRKIRPGNMLE